MSRIFTSTMSLYHSEQNVNEPPSAPILEDTPKITYEMIDETNKPIVLDKRSVWKKMFGLK